MPDAWSVAQVQRVAPECDGPVLDVGAGEFSSWFRPIFADLGLDYQAMDPIWADGVDIVSAAGPDGPDLPSYQTILLLSVLEHAPDPFAAFGWTAAHLAPGGRLLVAVPYCWGYHEFPGDYWRILPDGLRLLFARHDLTEEEMVMSGERMDETGQVFAVGRRA